MTCFFFQYGPPEIAWRFPFRLIQPKVFHSENRPAEHFSPNRLIGPFASGEAQQLRVLLHGREVLGFGVWPSGNRRNSSKWFLGFFFSFFFFSLGFSWGFLWSFSFWGFEEKRVRWNPPGLRDEFLPGGKGSYQLVKRKPFGNRKPQFERWASRFCFVFS